MEWFQGSIMAAIQNAKKDKAIFLVYVRGDDELSNRMNRTWEDETVNVACQKLKVVGITIESTSESCTQFSQIYPLVCIPCTFFIGENGVPLEVVGGDMEPTEFVKRIEKVCDLHKAQLSKQVGEPVTTATSTVENNTTTECSAKSRDTVSEETNLATPSTSQTDICVSAVEEKSVEAVDETVNPMQVEPVASIAPPTDSPITDSSLEGASASSSETPVEKKQKLDDEDKEQKIERAKELIAQKSEEKRKKEEQEGKNKETERRSLGKNLGKLEAWKKETEQKESINQWRKDKEEEKRAREHVKQQIARDREERAQKYQTEKQARERVQEQAKQAKVDAQTREQAQVDSIRREIARLQFRLPDGSSINNQFPSSDTLETARGFLKEKVGNSFGYFTLSTIFPRRKFTEADMSETLLDLNLAPSAVITVLPSSRVRPSKSDGGSSGSLLTMLLAPLLALWHFICNFFIATPPQPRIVQQPQTSPQNQDTQASPGTDVRSRQRPQSSYGMRSRREGNVRRLADLDDDDDMATWNGNSTQQM